MKQGVIRVKRDDVDVLGTTVYEVRMYSGTAKDGTGCERAEVVNIDYLTLLNYLLAFPFVRLVFSCSEV